MNGYDENILYAIRNFTPVRRIGKISSSDLEEARSRVPNSILALVENEGLLGFHDDLFRMCDPRIMAEVLALVFKSDSEFRHGHCCCIGYTAFGDLYLWSNELLITRVSLAEGFVFCTKLTNPDWPDPASIESFAATIIPEREFADFEDVNGEPMYDRCKDFHGRLEMDECYGFFPALSISGIAGPGRSIENIKRVKALEHFAILAQLTDFHLAKPSMEGVVPVRPIA